ncbi:MAG: terpene cyclase/mutase family protein [Planctomycetales bacterium]|nr:terpene cyclase/mutase family protein [Planctomycetales bacterium]
MKHSEIADIPLAKPTAVFSSKQANSLGPNSDDTLQNENLETENSRRRILSSLPSWLVSLVVHLLLILLLAAISIDPVSRVGQLLSASLGLDSEQELDEFELKADVQPPDLPSEETITVPTPVTQAMELALEVPEFSMPQPVVDVVNMNSLTERILPSNALSTSAFGELASALNSRSASMKSEMLERYGGNTASEKSVALALKWLAEHQASNGGWTFAHNIVCRNACLDPGQLSEATNGATAMALLPFLGAGQTHLEGDYKPVVKAGLAFLIRSMRVTSGPVPYGSWHEPGGRMYSHGLAAITVCEAYALTKDPDLRQPAQLSLNYLVYAQDPHGGGWRYEPKQPGDTSVVGWCLMALKSGRMGDLSVPVGTFQASDRFLTSVSTDQGAYYGYNKPTASIDGRQSTIAVGLLCRMYLGWPKDHPGLLKGISYLDQRGPKLNDLYYTYYATQVMRHFGGPMWERWNSRLRDSLINSQELEGHAAGSWKPSGSHSEKGGRLYATSLSAMILEVYYRHMPLYTDRTSEIDFEL